MLLAILLAAPAVPVRAQQGGASPHGALALPCVTCHTADAWRPARVSADFKHAAYGFRLDEGHGAVACTSCHTSLDFSRVQRNCAGCHRDVHQGELGTDCAQCHNTRTFADRSLQQTAHAMTRFPLEGAHRTLDCAACHTARSGSSMVFRGAPTDCVSCHRRDFEGTTSPNHPAAGFPTSCTDCHSNATWRRSAFDHNKTSFALTGAHQAAACQACHGDGVYKGKPTTCLSCHQVSFNQTRAPPHQAAGFATDCTSCHTTQTWQGAPFDHRTTRFPLTGAHGAATCQDCHADGVYVGKPVTCVSCHLTAYNQSRTPPHQSAGFPTDCTTCHTTTRWTGAVFDHNATQFALTGAHQAASCQACHGDGVYKGKPTSCVSCHQADFSRTANPPHQAAGFSTGCTSCHTTTRWTGAVFNHTTTQFPLTGAHQATACQACHGDGVYRGKPTTCVSCHQTDYSGATPNHQASGFSTGCTSCHTTVTWSGAVFNHGATRFPLTGAHQATACQACHGDGVYRGKPTACVSCHQADYGRTTNPPHQSAGFPTECTVCHGTSTWTTATFNHNASDFPLTGAHQAVSCQSCHGDGVYNGKPTACVSCHQADYGSATPNHQASGFSTGCSTCHTTITWSGAVFNHGATDFPLTGAHLATTCQACHGDGVYNGKSTACVSCHQPDYAGTTNPPHQAAGFPTSCTGCHTTATWTGATFNHGTTDFPLTGAHLAASCQACHGDGVYNGKPTACVSCHQPDYAGTTAPPHQAAGFATTCASCHTTVTWTGGTFNHSTTSFPLTGAHVTTPCNACHGDGVYNGKPTACVSCHQADYTSATPNHQAAGFPTTCTSCHTTTRWSGATFDHDGPWFPIYSGKHKGKWSTCTQCHTNAASYAEFTCLSCHEHNKTSMDDKHKNRSGYSYQSTACYSCHPRGN